MKNHESQNPFQALSANSSNVSDSRTLDYTPNLITRANARAIEIMKKGSEFAELANRVITVGDTNDLLEFIRIAIPEGQIESDAAVLDGCPEDQLARLLESRRSDRSKSKKKGLKSVVTCRTYISSMYAELMIRIKMGKPYTGASNLATYDADDLAKDQDALNRKIASLRSKQSRLKPLAAYDADADEELKQVMAEIDRLTSLRTGTQVRTKTVVKNVDVDTVREMLKTIDPASLPEDEQAKLLELMSKLG